MEEEDEVDRLPGYRCWVTGVSGEEEEDGEGVIPGA